MVPMVMALALVVCFNSASAETLRIARPGGPSGLGNPFTSVAQPSSGVWSLLFDALTVFDKSGQLKPGLALSWQNTSPTTWEFTLRPNVMFQSGRSMDATAVVDSLKILLPPSGKAYYVYPNLDTLEDVRVINPLTIEVITKTPDPILPQRLSLAMIVDPVAWQALGPEQFARTPVGTGPYSVKDWGAGNKRLKLEAFDGSWRKPISVTEIEMITIPEPTGRMQALLSGVVDVVEQAAQIKGIGEYEELKSFAYSTSQVSMLVFRVVGNKQSPVANKDVRKALSHVVNRAAISEVIFDRQVEPANQPVTPDVNGYVDTLPEAVYDPEFARSLLRDTGFDQGINLKARYVNSTAEDELEMLQFIAQDARKVGVQIDLVPTTLQNYFSMWQSGEWGDTDMFLALSDGSLFFDAARPLRILSCEKPKPFGCNETLTPLLAGIDQTMDLKARSSLVRDLVTKTVADYPAIWLTSVSTRVVTNDRVIELPVRPQGLAYDLAKLRGQQ